MSASLKTRDGSPSIAGLIEARDSEANLSVPASMEEVLAWARENRVGGLGHDPIRKVNEKRHRLGVPPFLVRAGMHRSNPEQFDRKAPHSRGALVASEGELRRLIEHHSGTVTGLVTPEIAGWLLDRNKGNRPLNKFAVQRFSDILGQGRWRNTGEPVIISREGILNDGQHRLSAIHDTDIGAELDLRFGVPRDAFYVTGTGTRRTAGNAVAIAGHMNATKQAGVARLLHFHDLGHMAMHAQSVDNDTILEVIGRNPAIGEVASSTNRAPFKPVRTAAFGFALVLATRVAPLEKVLAFAKAVTTGLASSEDDGAHRLHVSLLAREQRLDQLDLAVLTIRAWNAWIEERPVERLSVRDTDRTSAGFPSLTGTSQAV